MRRTIGALRADHQLRGIAPRSGVAERCDAPSGMLQ
jgi:hypothetical protein